MSAIAGLGLAAAAGLGFFWAVAYLAGSRPGAEKTDAGGKKVKVRLAFGYAVLVLLAHRAAMTYMLLSTDFSSRDAQAFFGMSWWFLDPVAGFPIIFGTMPFTKDMPLPRFINSYYVPLSILLYGGLIYGLWRLSCHAFRAAKPAGESRDNSSDRTV